MRVLTLKLMNFMSYASKVFNFPQSGIIFITGPNGSGKSSILEAVSMALWGRSLRGASPWHNGLKGKVVCEILVDGKQLKVVRERDATDKKTLSFSVDGVDHSFPTTTKAQEALCTYIGEWDIWRKTAVLSSQDAAHFSSATDTEKKRLLESLIGLEKYERAQKLLKDQTNELQAALTKAQFSAKEKQTNSAVLSASLGRLIDSRRTLAELQEQEAETKRKQQEDLIAKQAKVTDTEAKMELMAKSKSELQAKLASISRSLELHSQANATECFACGTKLKQAPDERHKELLRQLNETDQELAKTIAVWRSWSNQRQMDLFAVSSLEATINEINSKLADSTTKLDAEIAKVTEELEAAKQSEIVASELAAKAQMELDVNKHAIELLSVRRIRSKLLGAAIDTATPLIQMRLSQLTDDISIAISPTSELANGSLKDSISLKITGAGGSDGYSGCSGGQRRRIDVGILLGLADLACAYTGRDRESLFLDEIFDALDTLGIERVQDLLTEIANTEQVFLISHTAMTLPAAMQIHTGA